ncbi:MAG: phage tail tube protein [Kiritimatiellia bacterium]
MGQKYNKRILFAKLEDTYGEDAEPTGSDAMLVGNLEANPLNAELVRRNPIRPYFGISDSLIAQSSGGLGFEIELAGAGVKGLAPAWARLLLACGFGETINTTSISAVVASGVATVTKSSHGLSVGDKIITSGFTDTELNGQKTVATVPNGNTFTFATIAADDASADGTPLMRVAAVYAPITDDIPSLTFYYNLDGILHKMLGARGSVEIGINVKNIPVMKFTFISLYAAPVEDTADTPDFTGFQQPKVANTSNTTGYSLFGYAGLLEQVNLNMACGVEFRALIGEESVIISDRQPAGNIVIEAPAISDKDYFTLARDGTKGALTITHGTANGHKVTLAAPAVSIGNPSYQDSQGTAMLNIPISATPVSGNDEVVITAA